MVSRLSRTLLIIILLSGCQVYNSSTWDELKYAQLTGYFSTVQTLFSSKCTPCHNFHTYSEQQFIDENLVTAGDALTSPIYYRIKGSGSNNNENMPPNDQLTLEELDSIKIWIENL